MTYTYLIPLSWLAVIALAALTLGSEVGADVVLQNAQTVFEALRALI